MVGKREQPRGFDRHVLSPVSTRPTYWRAGVSMGHAREFSQLLLLPWVKRR